MAGSNKSGLLLVNAAKIPARRFHSFCLAASGLLEIHLLSSHVRHCTPSANLGSNNYLPPPSPFHWWGGFSNPVQHFPERKVPFIYHALAGRICRVEWGVVRRPGVPEPVQVVGHDVE